MIPTPCIEPYCPNMAVPGPRKSRCAAHQKAWDRERNKRPDRQAYADPVYRSVVIDPVCSVDGCDELATKDHIIELHKGGSNIASNIQALCLVHNLEKSNRERQSN